MSSLLQVLEEKQTIPFHPFSLFLTILFSYFLFLFVFNGFSNFTRRSTQAKEYRLPPSPFKLPIVGNLHQLLLSSPNMHRTLRSLSQCHGPLMLLQLGNIPTVVVSSPDIAREILKTHDIIFASRPKVIAAERLLYNYKDLASAPYGEYWRQVRKICILQLLSVKKVQSFRRVREEETALLIENIRRSCFSSPSLSAPVNLSESLVSLTNDIICRVAFGRKYSGGEGGRRFRRLMSEFGALLGMFNVGDYIPSFAWVNYFNGLNTRLEKTFRELDCFLDQVVKDHVDRKKKKENGDGVDEDDLVDTLLEIAEDGTIGIPLETENIKAIILDMFAAGTDTTYTVMEWVMAELLKHPEAMKELQEEVRSVSGSGGKPIVTQDETERMGYLKLVIKETLRLHPPLALLVQREASEDVKIQGYDIPAKTRVIINAWAIGRDGGSWEEAEEFKPKRFLMSRNDLVDFNGREVRYIPFGAGRRGCPGTQFGMAVNELVLANLVNSFDWKLPGGASARDLDMTEGSGGTIHKKLPLLAVATPH